MSASARRLGRATAMLALACLPLTMAQIAAAQTAPASDAASSMLAEDDPMLTIYNPMVEDAGSPSHRRAAEAFAKVVPCDEIVPVLMGFQLQKVPVRQRARLAQLISQELRPAAMQQLYLVALMSSYAEDELLAAAAFYATPAGARFRSNAVSLLNNHFRFQDEILRATKAAMDRLAADTGSR